jgi:hypothetical protein
MKYYLGSIEETAPRGGSEYGFVFKTSKCPEKHGEKIRRNWVPPWEYSYGVEAEFTLVGEISKDVFNYLRSYGMYENNRPTRESRPISDFVNIE